MNKIKEELKYLVSGSYDIRKGKLEKGLNEGLGGNWKVVLKQTNKEEDVLKVDGYGCESYDTKTVYALAAVRGSKGVMDAKEGKETENSIIFVNMVYGGYFGNSISKYGSDDPDQTIPLERYYGHKVYGDKLDNIIDKLAMENIEILFNERKEKLNKELNEKKRDVESRISRIDEKFNELKSIMKEAETVEQGVKSKELELEL